MEDPAPAPTPAPLTEALPATPKKTRLTRDDRLRIRTLREVGWSYQDIVSKYGFTYSGVQYACTHPLTPSKRAGRPPQMNQEQSDALVAFVTASQHNRRLPYEQIADLLGLTCGVESIKYALRKRGFRRCQPHSKPCKFQFDINRFFVSPCSSLLLINISTYSWFPKECGGNPSLCS